MNVQGRLVDVFFYDIAASPEDTWVKKIRNKVSIIERAWKGQWGADDIVIFRNCLIQDSQKDAFWGGENQPGYQLLERLENIEDALNVIKYK